PRTSSSYEVGRASFDATDELYRTGGWTVGGLQKVNIDKSLIQSLGDGFYVAPMNIETADAITVTNGKCIGNKLSEQNDHGFILKLQYADDGKWYLLDIKSS